MRYVTALLLVSLAVIITSSAEAKTVKAPVAAAQKGTSKEANAEKPDKGGKKASGKKGGKKAAAEEDTTQDSVDSTPMSDSTDSTDYNNEDVDGARPPPPDSCHEHVECAADEYCSYVFAHFGFECEKKAEKGTRCWRHEKCISGDCSYDLGILFWACQ